MRLLVWNCEGQLRKNAARIQSLSADIAVLSEVSPDCLACLGDDVSCTGIGQGRHGLAILGFNGWRIERDSLAIQERLFLPVHASKGDLSIQILGVCVKGDGGYVAPMLRAIDTAQVFISRDRTIVAGDFNQSAALRRTPHFSRVVEQLEALKLRSAWHSHHKEEFGKETMPTLYRWRKDSPSTRFHIDYAFVSENTAINTVSLGTFEDYPAQGLSDHVPLLVDLSEAVSPLMVPMVARAAIGIPSFAEPEGAGE